MSKTQITCDVKGCGYNPDYAFYPNQKRQEFLKVSLCAIHRDEMLETRSPKENVYRCASVFVTKSLV